jgi:hypothetical protein
MTPRVSRRALWILAGVAWTTTVLAGMAWVANYDNTPGVAASAPTTWPAGSRILRDPVRPTLVMLAHPRCDCTRASLVEMAELMARATPAPRAVIVFVRPGNVPGGWEQTGLWQAALDIPGVSVVRDDDGLEARRFGAQTSGQTLLYSPQGRLLFSGGTTGARGHAGDNVGRETILTLLEHENAHPAETSVFGCPLFDPTSGQPRAGAAPIDTGIGK